MNLRSKKSCRYYKCTPKQMAILQAHGVLVFERSSDTVAKWEQLRRGEVFVAKGGIGERLTCTVVARGFFLSNKAQRRSNITMASLAVRVTIKEAYIKCLSQFFCEKISLGEYQATVCQDSEDSVEDRIVTEQLNHHHYGPSSSVVNILVRKSGTVVGAALLDKYQPLMLNSTPSHSFSGYSHFSDKMYLVRRIVNSRPDQASSLRIQDICFRVCELFCTSIADENGMMLVGNSYDFLISAVKRGFKCEIPNSRQYPIFYWKPIRPQLRIEGCLTREELRQECKTYKAQYRNYTQGPVSNRFRQRTRKLQHGTIVSVGTPDISTE